MPNDPTGSGPSALPTAVDAWGEDRVGPVVPINCGSQAGSVGRRRTVTDRMWLTWRDAIATTLVAAIVVLYIG